MAGLNGGPKPGPKIGNITLIEDVGAIRLFSPTFRPGGIVFYPDQCRRRRANRRRLLPFQIRWGGTELLFAKCDNLTLGRCGRIPETAGSKWAAGNTSNRAVD